MKRFWFFSVSLLFVLAACGQSVATPTVTPAPTATPWPTLSPAPAATPAPTIQPGDSQRTLTVDGLERSYLLHIPPGLDSLQPAPVVFAFHGSTENAIYFQQYTGFNDTADKNSFILVYPNGVNRDWNLGGSPPLETGIDDFAFVRKMIEDLGTIVQIDPKRIYSTGFSAGANFSYRLACEMFDTFAAIAPVEGWLFTNPCQPQQPVAVFHVHGSKDAYEGQTVSMIANGVYVDVVFPPVEQAIATWVKLDGCNGAALIEKQGVVTHTVYPDCRAGTVVELSVINGGSHAWPSPYAFPSISTQGIWDFFKAHPKP